MENGASENIELLPPPEDGVRPVDATATLDEEEEEIASPLSGVVDVDDAYHKSTEDTKESPKKVDVLDKEVDATSAPFDKSTPSPQLPPSQVNPVPEEKAEGKVYEDEYNDLRSVGVNEDDYENGENSTDNLYADRVMQEPDTEFFYDLTGELVVNGVGEGYDNPVEAENDTASSSYKGEALRNSYSNGTPSNDDVSSMERVVHKMDPNDSSKVIYETVDSAQNEEQPDELIETSLKEFVSSAQSEKSSTVVADIVPPEELSEETLIPPSSNDVSISQQAGEQNGSLVKEDASSSEKETQGSGSNFPSETVSDESIASKSPEAHSKDGISFSQQVEDKEDGEKNKTAYDVKPETNGDFQKKSDSSNIEDDVVSSFCEGREDATAKTPFQKISSPVTTAQAADSSSKGNVSSNSQSRPAGLGSSASLLESTTRPVPQPRVNGSEPSRQTLAPEDVANGDRAEEHDGTREKLQMIRVKFLRLSLRLGQTPHNVVVAQVLYRLGLAEQLRGSMNTTRNGAFSFDRASAMAEQLEATGKDDLGFSCTIMVIGKTGVGKSATINSIFDESMFKTDAFKLGTSKVQERVGKVQGIQLKVIDTPGLSPCSSDQPKNMKILHAVKKCMKKAAPDVIMYLDRLDVQNRDLGDVPLLRSITNVFGPSIWFNAIVVLTHAASAPPDGPNGTPLSYEMYVTQRSHVIQQAIRQAAGDPRLLNPVSLVENHSACRMNRAGQRVLPNGQVWKPHLLLLSFASKILTEANTLLKLQDSPVDRPFELRTRAPPLPFLLSSLLQSRSPPKLPDEQYGDDDSFDVELEEIDLDEVHEYDELPPFKNLTKEELRKLSPSHRKAYYEELDYREKLFYKKHMKEEKKRRKLLKKMEADANDLPADLSSDNVEDETGGVPSVPVPMPDLALPSSFDSDSPSYRYRFLDSSNQWLVRPVLEAQGWDHDIGYEGLNFEKLFVVKDKVPVSLSGQFTKDKKDCHLQMEVASSIKHGEGKATSVGMDMQTVGKDLACTLRGETQFNNFRFNSTTAGVSATFLGDTMSTGLKVEDKLVVNKRVKLLVAGGAMTSRGDAAYGGRVEATIKDKDYPLGRALSTLALSVVDWHGDLAIGLNLQSQIPMGRHSNIIGHASLNNKGTGQIGLRLNSSEHLQLALLAFVPIYKNTKRLLFGSDEVL